MTNDILYTDIYKKASIRRPLSPVGIERSPCYHYRWRETNDLFDCIICIVYMSIGPKWKRRLFDCVSAWSSIWAGVFKMPEMTSIVTAVSLPQDMPHLSVKFRWTLFARSEASKRIPNDWEGSLNDDEVLLANFSVAELFPWETRLNNNYPRRISFSLSVIVYQ